MSSVLVLRLEGPLQSWGERSRWDVRETADRPTKSAVIGLLGAALGLKRNSPKLVEMGRQLRFAVRVDRPGQRMVDFHTVSGALPSADGKTKGKEDDPYTLLTPRTYLQDASFLVALEGPEEMVEECALALKQPRWPYFLGRKCCPPAVPVFAGVERNCSLKEALQPQRHPVSVREKSRKPKSVSVYSQDAKGDFEVRDRWLGTPGREYGTTRYTLDFEEVTAECI